MRGFDVGDDGDLDTEYIYIFALIKQSHVLGI